MTCPCGSSAFLNAPYGTNIPHPQIVPIPQGGRTYYLLITFNGTQYYENVLGYGTHGDLIIMRAAQTGEGLRVPPNRHHGVPAAGRAGVTERTPVQAAPP